MSLYELLDEMASSEMGCPKDERKVANMILGEYRATYCQDGEDDEDFDDRIEDLVDYWINDCKYIDNPTRQTLIFIKEKFF